MINTNEGIYSDHFRERPFQGQPIQDHTRQRSFPTREDQGVEGIRGEFHMAIRQIEGLEYRRAF